METIPTNPKNYDNTDNPQINSYGMPTPVNAKFHLIFNESISNDIITSEVLVN